MTLSSEIHEKMIVFFVAGFGLGTFLARAQIHFHTLRHWKATMEYHRTKDILHVKYILGHKSVKTTERYVHYQPFEAEDYMVKRAKTAEEEDELIEAAFELVRYDQERKEAIYRKRK